MRFDDLPNRQGIDIAQVVVNQDVAKAIDLPPGDVGATRLLFIRQPLGGFREGLQITKGSIVEDLVLEEIAACLDEADFFDGIQDMMGIGGARTYSKVDGLRQYLVPKIGAELMFGYHIDRMIQKFRQGLGERQALTEQIIAAWEIHQEIHVAVRAFLTPHHGTEDADAPGAVAPAQLSDEGFLGFQFVQLKFHRFHRTSSEKV